MQVCRVSAGSRHRLPAPQTHTCSLLLCYTRPTRGVLVMKSLCCLLVMCWLSFLFLVCFPCHCIWSVGKCFISWGQSPSFLWAWWLRLCLESALAVSCLGIWVMQRLGGCGRRRALSQSQSLAIPVPLDLQKFWWAEKLGTAWKSQGEPTRVVEQ